MIQELVDIGHNLYESLFPEGDSNFKQEYCQVPGEVPGQGAVDHVG